MIYVEGNGGKSSLFILPPRRSHHRSVNSKPMRILRAYLLTLEGVNPGYQIYGPPCKQYRCYQDPVFSTA